MSLKNASTELRQAALNCLAEADATVKANAVRQLASHWQLGEVRLDSKQRLISPAQIPGRPIKPELVAPKLLKRRAMTTPEGRAALIHALAHIEFNAINLALDVIWRFSDMPTQFYVDWLKVADEEAYHFSLLNAHLQQLGFYYGDFDAHNSLWEMADKTKSSILARIALVPRTMEARGLDASPQLRAKLAQAGDKLAAEILDIILRDEIGHVSVGNHWFNWLCEQQRLEPLTTFAQLCLEYEAPKLRGPFNIEARRQAGFSEAELESLVAT
jgi:uncharacterized ferritin-like protein (DUF455 family)